MVLVRYNSVFLYTIVFTQMLLHFSQIVPRVCTLVLSFSHVKILRALVLHLTHIALAHMESLGKRLHTGTRWGGRGGRFALHVLERAPRGYCATPPTSALDNPAFNRGPAFISRTSVLTPGVY